MRRSESSESCYVGGRSATPPPRRRRLRGLPASAEAPLSLLDTAKPSLAKERVCLSGAEHSTGRSVAAAHEAFEHDAVVLQLDHAPGGLVDQAIDPVLDAEPLPARRRAAPPSIGALGDGGCRRGLPRSPPTAAPPRAPRPRARASPRRRGSVRRASACPDYARAGGLCATHSSRITTRRNRTIPTFPFRTSRDVLPPTLADTTVSRRQETR